MENKDDKYINKLKILLILSNVYDHNMPSWPEIMGVFGSGMQKKGHSVDWILPNRSGILNRISKTIFRNADLYLIPLPKRNNVIIEFISIILFQFRLFLLATNLIKKNNYDIIIVRDDELSGITALFIKLLFNKKLIFNYSFPHYLGTLNRYNKYNKNLSLLLYNKILDVLLNYLILPQSDYFFPISDEMKCDYLNNGMCEDKMTPLPLGVDFSIFNNDDKSVFINQLGIKKDDFIFMYVGSLDLSRGLELLILAFKNVIKIEKHALLVFIGSGDGMDILVKLVFENDLTDRIHFTNKVPFSDIPRYLNEAHVGLSIIQPLDCYRVCSPCKLFEYMAMKKPVIANIEIPEHKKVIDQSQSGILSDYTINSITNAMLKMIEIHRDSNSIFIQMGLNGYQWVAANRSFDILTDDVENGCLKALNMVSCNNKKP